MSEAPGQDGIPIDNPILKPKILFLYGKNQVKKPLVYA